MNTLKKLTCLSIAVCLMLPIVGCDPPEIWYRSPELVEAMQKWDAEQAAQAQTIEATADSADNAANEKN